MPVDSVIRTVMSSLLLFGLTLIEPAWALSAKERAQVYAQSPASLRAASNMKQVNSIAWFHTQIYTAELMNRDDIVEGALERLLAVSPSDSVGLMAQARLSIRKNQTQKARNILNQLNILHPNSSSVVLLKSYVSIHTDKSAEYKQLKLFEKLGRTRETIAKYDALFPYGMPTNKIKLDYLSLLGEIKANWARVKNDLEQLNYRYPGVPVLQLRLASHINKRKTGDPWVLSTLKRLSLDHQVGEQAARTWLKALSDMPVNEKWAKQHVILASYFPRDLEIQQANRAAQSRWQQEKEWRKDPTYLAKLRGVALINADNPQNLPSAYKQLSYALTTRPKDPQLLEAMGKYYLRLGQSEQALVYFKRAKQYDDDPDNYKKHRTLISTVQFWTYLDRGDHQATEGNLSEARKFYAKAQGILPEEPHSYTKLADIAMVEKNYSLAISRYQQALQKAPLNKTALQGVLNTYIQQQQLKAALRQAVTFTTAQQKIIQPEIDKLRVELLFQQLQSYPASGNDQQVAKVLDELMLVNPADPWLKKVVADQLLSWGRHNSANRMMANWAKDSHDPEMAFAYGLFLSRQDRLDEAVAVIESVSYAKRSKSMNTNLERLKFQQVISRAEAIYEQEPERAVRLLQSYAWPEGLVGQLRLALAWVLLGDQEKAKSILGTPEPASMDDASLLDYGEVLVALDDDKLFRVWRQAAGKRQFTDELQAQFYQIVTDYELYSASADFAVGNIAQAHQTFQTLLNSAVVSQDEIAIRLALTSHQLGDSDTFTFVTQRLIQRQPQLTYSQQLKLAEVLYDTEQGQDASQLLVKLTERQDGTVIDKWESLTVAMENQQWETAETLAYQTLLADRQGKQPAQGPEQNLTLKTMYLEADDYWLTRKVKADIDTLRARKDGHIKVGLDYSFREGEDHGLNVPFEVRIPFSEYEGHLIVKVDYVRISSGDQNFYDSNIRFDHQHTGVAPGIGWEAKNWRADIGATPLGFLNPSIVGGVEQTYDFDSYTLRAVLSRRPETSTTLSYSGIDDVAPSSSSKQEWGGVLKTGMNLGLSWDEGGAYGVWSNVQFHYLDGHNTVDNTRVAVMGGGYWKVVAEDSQRLNIGTSAFYMGYDKNLGEYAVGHGGYYSPQSYFSISLPVSYYGRINNTWAYLAYGSVSNSWSELDTPYGLNGSDDSGGGFGYSLRLALEKRVSSKWYLGVLLDAQRSESYEPNHFQFYAKYTFSQRWQPIETPPEPVTLYANYY